MYQKHISILLLTFLTLTACNNKHNDKTETTSLNREPKQIQRFGMVTGLNREKMDYYKELHGAVWPAVLKKINDCNIHNYSIFLKEIDGKPYLFSYFEYTGSDFNADMKKMADDTTTQRWWKETAPCQQPLPDAVSKNQVWSNMEEVFHQE